MNVMLQIPALFYDVSNVTPLATSLQSSVSHASQGFSVTLLTLILPKLNFTILPIGILTILPWRNPRVISDDTEAEKPKKQFGEKTVEKSTEISEEDLKLLPINLSKSPSTEV